MITCKKCRQIVGARVHECPSSNPIKHLQDYVGKIPWNKNKKGLQVAWNKGKVGIYSQETLNKMKMPKTQEAKTRMSLAKKGKVDSLRMRAIGLKGLLKQQNMKEPTSIEKAVYDYLVLKGIVFEKQKLINGRFIVDAYIPSLNLVVEADGKYWHSLPKAIGRDKSRNAYLKKCGYNMIRLSEEEIKSGVFKERLA